MVGAAEREAEDVSVSVASPLVSPPSSAVVGVVEEETETPLSDPMELSVAVGFEVELSVVVVSGSEMLSVSSSVVVGVVASLLLLLLLQVLRSTEQSLAVAVYTQSDRDDESPKNMRRQTKGG